MKDKQAEHENDLGAMWNGVRRIVVRRKWRQLEQRVIALKADLTNGVRTLDQYWDAICHMVQDFE